MPINQLKSTLDALEIIPAGEISIDKIHSLLDNAQIFRNLEWPQIETLSSYIQLYRAKPGDVLFCEGDKSDFMCIVLQGKLDIRKQNNQLEDKSVATVLAGRSLGEMAMVDSEARSATALVLEPAILAILTHESFMAIACDKPALGVKLLLKIAQLISQRLRHTSGVLVDFLEK
jgi:CRP-like cAMP-binding protein